MSDRNLELAKKEAARLEGKYGLKAGATGATEYKLNVYPTGSLALDYALGTGGWPYGHPVEIFGAPDIGKSSVLGFSAIRNAQAAGKLCALIAVEPGFDEAWAIKNGVDPERLVIARPDNGEEAFSMLHDFITGDIIDNVVFDWVGALIRESEGKEDGKPAAMGQAALIAWGVKRILTPIWKNNKGVLFLNQQRDDKDARYPGAVEAPGGWAVKHCSAIRVHLKTGGSPYKATVQGQDKPIEIGRTLVAVIKRNKLSEGSSKRAEFDYYQMDTDDHAVGIDMPKDVISTAIRTQVITKSGGWYKHPLFPGSKNQFQGRDPVDEFLLSNPKAVEHIRGEVLKVMYAKQGDVKNTQPDLKVVDGSEGK